MMLRRHLQKFPRRPFLIATLILSLFYLALNSCSSTRIILQTAPNQPTKNSNIIGLSYDNYESWNADRDRIINLLKRDIYGDVPQGFNIDNIIKTPLETQGYEGQSAAEIWQITQSYKRDDGQKMSMKYNIVLVLPQSDIPVSLITMQNFCPSHVVLPRLEIQASSHRFCEGDGILSSIFEYIFGRYIRRPPIKEILNKNYGFVTFYPAAVIPDHPQLGRKALDHYFGTSHRGAAHNASAIAAWAFMWMGTATALADDPRIDKQNIAALGHSRYGKSALLAAALSQDISAVISHQSGTGGASLSRGKKGETVTQIMASYPHWFAPNYAKYDRGMKHDIEQHHLLALIAPKSLLLGNARRDVWSDPQGGFQAAQLASPIYDLYGRNGLTAAKLNQFISTDNIAYWIRPGTHGITKEDWDAFFQFLDIHIEKEN